MVPVNYLAILVCGIASMALGFLWYGPLFGTQWLKLVGFTQQQMQSAKAKGMGKSYVLMFVGSLLMAFVLAHNLEFASTYMQVGGAQVGLTSGFWNWLGFVVPVTLGGVLWENKPWKLWFINIGYYLVLMLIMGVILASWK